jgi:glycosyltransferase involved in cell wall biosynthesis
MRFCIVNTFYPPYHFGGDATYVRALSRALVSRGHEVEVVHCEDAYRVAGHSSQEAGAADSRGAEDEGIIVHRLKSRLGILSPLLTQQTGHPVLKSGALKKILDRDFDVVNFHNISLVGGPAVLRLSNAPVTLYSLHEHWLLCPTHIFWKNRRHACDRPQCLGCSLRSGIPPQIWRYTNAIRRSLAGVDALLAPSEFTASKHREAGLGKNIRVLPLFSIMDPGTPATFHPASRPRFLFAGRVTASKGIVPLLNTFAKLKDMDLQVIGDGDLLAGLRHDYAHCRNIIFEGPLNQEQLVQHYQEANALILPSLAPETFGLSVIEAFACATPAIVREAGGSRELVDSTGAGLVYRTDAELESAVHRLASDTNLRKELGGKARQGFSRLYTATRHLDAYLALVADIQRQKGLN